MTAPVRSTVKCKQCGTVVTCPACGEKLLPSTPFSDWLRALPPPYSSEYVSNQNLDYIWHVYKENWLITIEEKRYGGASNFAQQDTHGIVAQMLEYASGCLIITSRGVVKPIEYRGHYVLRFEQTTPEDSAWMQCNGKPIDKDDLLQLLRIGSTPKR